MCVCHRSPYLSFESLYLLRNRQSSRNLTRIHQSGCRWSEPAAIHQMLVLVKSLSIHIAVVQMNESHNMEIHNIIYRQINEAQSIDKQIMVYQNLFIYRLGLMYQHAALNLEFIRLVYERKMSTSDLSIQREMCTRYTTIIQQVDHI